MLVLNRVVSVEVFLNKGNIFSHNVEKISNIPDEENFKFKISSMTKYPQIVSLF